MAYKMCVILKSLPGYTKLGSDPEIRFPPTPLQSTGMLSLHMAGEEAKRRLTVEPARVVCLGSNQIAGSSQCVNVVRV